jgi:hypothetical protein
MEEIWKDIKDYEGLYQVSNLGRIKSLKRKVYAGNNKLRWQYEKILSNNKTNGRGYKIVSLSKENKAKNKYIHRLVAETFLENPNNYKYINHKDEKKENNCVDNLEFCSAQYNATYNNLHIRNGLKNRNNKYSKKIMQLDDSNIIIKEYPSIKEASRQMKVSFQSISNCLKGKQKHSAGYRWKYKE